jgi:hypothetical protein
MQALASCLQEQGRQSADAPCTERVEDDRPQIGRIPQFGARLPEAET